MTTRHRLPHPGAISQNAPGSGWRHALLPWSDRTRQRQLAELASALGLVFLAATTKLELRVKNTSRQRLTRVLGEQSRSVWVQHGDLELQIPLENVQVGDVVSVHAGEATPVDGTIIAGTASIDQHMLTGESQPAEKGVGDSVFAATIVLSGKIYVQVEKAGADAIVANIETILNRTADYTSSTELKGQVFADKSVLPTLAVSAMTLSILGPEAAVSTFPCYMGNSMKPVLYGQQHESSCPDGYPHLSENCLRT